MAQELGVSPGQVVTQLFDFLDGRRDKHQGIADKLERRGQLTERRADPMFRVVNEKVGAVRYLTEIAKADIGPGGMNADFVVPRLVDAVLRPRADQASYAVDMRIFTEVGKSLVDLDPTGQRSIQSLVRSLEPKTGISRLNAAAKGVRNGAVYTLLSMAEEAARNTGIGEGMRRRLADALEIVAKYQRASPKELQAYDVEGALRGLAQGAPGVIRERAHHALDYLAKGTAFPMIKESTVEDAVNYAVQVTGHATTYETDIPGSKIREQAVVEFKSYLTNRLRALDPTRRRAAIEALQNTLVEDAKVSDGAKAVYYPNDRRIVLREDSWGKISALIELSHESDHLIDDLLTQRQSKVANAILAHLDPRSRTQRMETSAFQAQHGFMQKLWALGGGGHDIAQVVVQELAIPAAYRDLLIEIFSSAKMENGKPKVEVSLRAKEMLRANPELLTGMEDAIRKGLQGQFDNLFFVQSVDAKNFAKQMLRIDQYRKTIRQENTLKTVQFTVMAGLLAFAWYATDRYAKDHPVSTQPTPSR